MKELKDYIDIIHSYQHDIKLMATEMAKDAGRAGSHVGGSFSCIEIFSVLYGGILNYDVKNPYWDERDRFIPSKTHCILSNFSALVKAGFIRRDELMSFHADGGMLAGHPWNVEIGLEFAGGSLGMGVGVAVGRALFAKRYDKAYKTYALLGDGECNEGSVWEAFMSASKFKLDNLIVIIDYDNMQFDGVNDEIMSLAPLGEKMKAFGFKVEEIDGHSIEQLWDAFTMPHEGQPLAVIAHTIKAHGVPSLENKAESHHAVITEEDYEYIMSNLRQD